MTTMITTFSYECSFINQLQTCIFELESNNQYVDVLS